MVAAGRLGSIPLFSALTQEERELVARCLDEVDVPAEERIISEKDFAYEFFVIEEGTARVEQDGVSVAKLGPGDFFGELGLLVTGRRTAAVVAETPMTMLAMFDQRFRRLERDLPALSEAIRTEMRARFSKPSPA